MSVASAPPAALRQLRSIQRTPAQERILTAALDLFADHGVSGTSLQMIADAVGVSKAAVYHQFNAKSDIVLAVAEAELAKLEGALEAAEAEPSETRARGLMLSRVIDLAVTRRRWVGALQNDPVMIRLLAGHPPLQQLMERVYGLLIGDASDAEARVAAAMMAATIGAAVVHPLVVELDDDTLRHELLRVAGRIFDV